MFFKSFNGFELDTLMSNETIKRAVDRCIDDLVISYDKPRFDPARILAKHFPAFETAAQSFGLIDRKDAQTAFGLLVYRSI